MRIRFYGFLFVLNLLPALCYPANAPVTFAGEVMNATTLPSAVKVPVTVLNFEDIGLFSLSLNYQTSVLDLTGVWVNPAFEGRTIDTATSGVVKVSWTGTTGISLPDRTTVIELTFTYTTGTSSLAWNTSGTACQFKKYIGGNLVALNDTPKATFYHNGVVTSHAAPVTYAPVIQNAVPGNISVPLSVKNFTNIGSLSLSLLYDPSVLTYMSTYTPNPAFISNFLVGSQPGINGHNFLFIQWFGNALTLPDSSVLVTITFNLANTVNGVSYSALDWYDTGPSCLYTDGQAHSLYDSNFPFFYRSGCIAKQVSPFTALPRITAAIPSGTVQVPVKTSAFTNITSFVLAFKYDSTVISLPAGGYTPNPLLGGSFILTNHPAGPDGLRTIIMSWNGGPATLPDSTSLVDLTFNYALGATVLDWITGGDTSIYKDSQQNALWKFPAESYFLDGSVTSHPSPETSAAHSTVATGQSVTIPVAVRNFDNIGQFYLTLLYDPGALGSPSASMAAPIGGSFSFSNPGPGKLIMQWSGTPCSLPDSTVLLHVSFTGLGKESPLQWLCSNNSCKYAESAGFPPLFNIPLQDYYIDGFLSKAPVINVKLFLEGPYSTGAMSTTLNTSGLIPLNQPYNAPPWNFNGNEHVTVIPAGVTDWILVELRAQSSSSSAVAVRAGFLKNDGCICGTDGATQLGFSGILSGNYYLVIRHRNHLPVMSAIPAALDTSSTIYDFTLGPAVIYGGANGVKLIDPGTGTWGMVAGDANCNGNVFVDDYTNCWIPAFGMLNAYNCGDFNLDGSVFVNDYTDYWIENFGTNNSLP